MAKESVKILQGKLDVESLISQLNAALAEEWLAYYQYWIGALVVEGAMRPNVQSEFEEHANEERKHAEMIAKRSCFGSPKVVGTGKMQIRYSTRL